MDKNKPTADYSKAIHRRLELSFNLYLLLLLWVKTELSKKPPTYNPGFSASCSFSTNKTFEGQLKPSKPFSYRKFSWLTLLYLYPLFVQSLEQISGKFLYTPLEQYYRILLHLHDAPTCCNKLSNNRFGPFSYRALLRQFQRHLLLTIAYVQTLPLLIFLHLVLQSMFLAEVLFNTYSIY